MIVARNYQLRATISCMQVSGQNCLTRQKSVTIMNVYKIITYMWLLNVYYIPSTQ